ncbi:hypothetical protein DO71_6029 [Burkholderia pseudomallei]|uniref:hypothetical protein n=1 Tax=Burkholderia pseudomallei TaxID=28450 RepID=UPI00050FCB2D|nr:hypothetical protein [Burkholderia pseudomallei]KGC91220.1 hypothetical protein DO71_6029 [Burkholderia pseudomallei]KGV19750.1 hypothetical protein X891_4782 [Burkholderia pseudomallei TSV 43]KGV31524.1 hypothetical protein X893_3447 [Burkholderia pseudomallei TSV 31]
MKRTILNFTLCLATFSVAEWIAVGIFALGLLLSSVVAPLMARELNSQKGQLRQQERNFQRSSARPRARIDEAGNRLNHFYSVLVPEDQLERSIGKLFEIASVSGVKLEKADYRLATDKAGQYETYQVDLPLRANYAAIQTFCEQVLAEFPSASLDAIKFHREKVSNVQIEATLRLTIFAGLHTSQPTTTRPLPPAGTRLVSGATK